MNNQEEIKWWHRLLAIIIFLVGVYWGLTIIGGFFNILTSPPIYEAGECSMCDDFDSNYPH